MPSSHRLVIPLIVSPLPLGFTFFGVFLLLLDGCPARAPHAYEASIAAISNSAICTIIAFQARRRIEEAVEEVEGRSGSILLASLLLFLSLHLYPAPCPYLAPSSDGVSYHSHPPLSLAAHTAPRTRTRHRAPPRAPRTHGHAPPHSCRSSTYLSYISLLLASDPVPSAPPHFTLKHVPLREREEVRRRSSDGATPCVFSMTTHCVLLPPPAPLPTQCRPFFF